MGVPANSLDVTQAGLVKFDGINSFTGVTVTNHNVLLGSTSNSITSVAPSATSGVPLISQGAAADPAFGTVAVAGGGTGAVTLTGVLIGNGTSAVTGNPVTNHALLLGGASNAITSSAVGATGTILNGHTGADPTFDTSTVGSYTFTQSTAGTGESLTVSQTDNSNGNSSALMDVVSGGTSGGDPFLRIRQGSANSYAFGINHTDTNRTLIIRYGTNGTATPSSGDTPVWQVDKNGQIRAPQQPSLSAFVHTAMTNATGDGTAVTVIFDSVVFEQFLPSSNYNSATGVYTCQSSDGGGVYLVTATVTLTSVGALFTTGEMGILSSAGTVTRKEFNPSVDAIGTDYVVSDSVIMNRAALDTIFISIKVSGSTKTVGIKGDNFGPFSYLSIVKLF